ncbi:MAG: cyclic nucleotide-binding domain-containing protein [Anaerolineaceae bacterium]|nr:cyclic nucleotide-binding domain-containing protein [Anaerolineaceae bacterium]
MNDISTMIPESELNNYAQYLRIYSKGKVIIREGQVDDQQVFLLRHGTVEIFKTIGKRQEILDRVEAVNFFGEMAVLSRQPRSATVVAASDPVVVYAINDPNLNAILSHPAWGKMLVGRIADSLGRMNREYEYVKTRQDTQSKRIAELIGLLDIFGKIADTNGYNAQVVLDAIPTVIKAFGEKINVKPDFPDDAKLERYYQSGILSDQLYRALVVWYYKNHKTD